MVIDSGSSGHYIKQSLHGHQQPCEKQYKVSLPNGQQIQDTHYNMPPITALPIAARKAYILPHLKEHSLFSFRQLCQSGCIAVFTAHGVNIYFQGQCIIHGFFNPHTNLYRTSLPIKNPTHNQKHHTCNTLMAPIHETKENLINLYHQTCFSPSKSTWLKAIRK